MKGVDLASHAAGSGMWYVLIAGKAVMISTTSVEGAQKKASPVNSPGYRTLGPGDVFGAYPLLVPGSMRHLVQATCTCTLLALPLEELEILKDVDSKAAHRIVSMSSDADPMQAQAHAQGPRRSIAFPTKDGAVGEPKEDSISRSARGGSMHRNSNAFGSLSSLEISKYSSGVEPPSSHGRSPDSTIHKDKPARGIVKHHDRERLQLWEAASDCGPSLFLPSASGSRGFGDTGQMSSGAIDIGLPTPGNGDEFSISSSDKKNLAVGHLMTEGEPLSEIERYTIKNALNIIQESWDLMSLGNTHISFSQLASLEKQVGEAGSELFKALFNGLDPTRTISEDGFWKYWVQFFEKAENEQVGSSGADVADDSQHGSAFDGSDDRRENDDGANDEQDGVAHENAEGWVDFFYSIVSPARSIKHLLFAEETMGRYEDTYIEIAGRLCLSLCSFVRRGNLAVVMLICA